MRRTITVLVLAAFIGSLVAATALAATTTSKPASTKKAAAKVSPAKPKPATKAKPAAKPFSKTEKGLNKGLTKATKFTKRTLTVPQKNPNAKKPNPNRKESNLVKGVHTSAHKAGKWIKGRTKIK